MMASAMEILWRQAMKTFAGRRSVGYQLCQKNFEKLQILINEIKASDVNINKYVLRFVEDQYEPMCVMEVFEDQDLTITIFMLKHGVTLPMHDHPGMHGLLKVLSGVVQVNSYTVPNSEELLSKPGKEIRALKHPSAIVRENDPACVLTPEERNFHEISCIQGPAVFLDILSPPYNSEPCNDDAPARTCTYFRESLSTQCTEPKEGAVEVKLIAMTRPPDFYSRRMSYLGPRLR